jgi:hypothetical protein
LLHELSLDKYHRYRTSTSREGSSQSGKDGDNKQLGPGITRKVKETISLGLQKEESKQPTADQPKPPPLEVLLPRTSKIGKVDLNFDFEGALSKMHVNVPLGEAIKIPSIKERFDTFFSGSNEPMDPPIMLQADHFRV